MMFKNKRKHCCFIVFNLLLVIYSGIKTKMFCIVHRACKTHFYVFKCMPFSIIFKLAVLLMRKPNQKTSILLRVVNHEVLSCHPRQEVGTCRSAFISGFFLQAHKQRYTLKQSTDPNQRGDQMYWRKRYEEAFSECTRCNRKQPL